MKANLIYCNYSNTIREMPQNHLVLIRDEGGRWILDPDKAIDKKLAHKVLDVLLDDGSYMEFDELITKILA